MDELSWNTIEEYCRTHNTSKSRRIKHLLDICYDLSAEIMDEDALFLEEAITTEENAGVRNALEDLAICIFL